MKLPFDHNLSPHLVRRLSDVYPDTGHVFLIGLDRASDMAVWNYAQTNDYIIVTKDLRLQRRKCAARVSAQSDLATFGQLHHGRYRTNVAERLCRD